MVKKLRVRRYTDIEEVLTSQRWKGLLKHRKGEICMQSMTVSDGAVAAIFASKDALSRMPVINALYLNTNSFILPDVANTQRSLVITALYQNRALTLGWVLLNEESRPMYLAIAESIKTELLGDVQPQRILCNTDWRMFSASRQSFATVPIAWTSDDFILSLLHVDQRQPRVDLSNEQHVQVLTKLVANYFATPSAIPG